MSIRQLIPYIFLLLFGLAAAFFYHWYQPAIDYKTNLLADANGYEKIYAYFQGDPTPYQVRFGIHNRIAIPFLASLIPGHDIEQSFFIVNTFFALLSFLAIYYLLCHFKIRKLYIFLILSFYALHWVGPFRQNAIDPVNVDMAVYGFEVLFLLSFLRKKYAMLLLITPFAIATKELFLALIIALLAISYIQYMVSKNNLPSFKWMTGIFLTGIVTKMILSHFFASNSIERNSLMVIAFHLSELASNPRSVFRWFLAVFAAYGAFIFLAFQKGIRWKPQDNDEWIVHLLSLSVLTLSVIGGMDYTRLIFLGFPYVMLSIMLLARPDTHGFLIAFCLSVVLTRPWEILPDPLLDMTLYNKWMPEVSDRPHLAYWSIAILICFSIVLIGRIIFRTKPTPLPAPE